MRTDNAMDATCKSSPHQNPPHAAEAHTPHTQNTLNHRFERIRRCANASKQPLPVIIARFIESQLAAPPPTDGPQTNSEATTAPPKRSTNGLNCYVAAGASCRIPDGVPCGKCSSSERSTPSDRSTCSNGSKVVRKCLLIQRTQS